MTNPRSDQEVAAEAIERFGPVELEDYSSVFWFAERILDAVDPDEDVELGPLVWGADVVDGRGRKLVAIAPYPPSPEKWVFYIDGGGFAVLKPEVVTPDSQD